MSYASNTISWKKTKTKTKITKNKTTNNTKKTPELVSSYDTRSRNEMYGLFYHSRALHGHSACVKLHLRHKRRDTSICRFVRLPRCVWQGRPSYGRRGGAVERGTDASQKFKGRDIIPGSTNKYTKFGQLIIRKIIKTIATRCHILKPKMRQIRFLVSVRLPLCPYVS